MTTNLCKKPLSLLLSTTLLLSSFVLTIPANATSYQLLNPITGTVQGTGYDESAGHDGIDLYPYNYGDPIYAVASGTIMYSCPRNHTHEYQSGDDLCSVKVILDEPITHNGITYVSAFYTHMSSLVYDVYCGNTNSSKSACIKEYNAGLRNNALPTESVHVEAGEIIGYVGKGNAATHLHLSFESGGADGFVMMPNSEYFEVFGWSYGETIEAVGGTSIPDYSVSTCSTGLTLAQLQAKFPDGKYWNHMGSSSNNADGWTNTPCSSHSSVSTCNAFVYNEVEIGWQCFGFALKLGYDAYGSNPKNWGRAYSLDNIKPGDIINYDGINPGHTVFVTAVDGDRVYFAECNWGGKCIINWDRSLNKSEFNNLYNRPPRKLNPRVSIDATADEI